MLVDEFSYFSESFVFEDLVLPGFEDLVALVPEGVIVVHALGWNNFSC